MKTRICQARRFAAVGAITCLALSPTLAADTASAPAAASAETPAATDNGPAKLPYGVADVVKLSRAQVSEDVILTYIQNSGTIYNLGPQDLVYLRDQGVSDRVINTMQDQRKKATEVAAQTAPPAYPDTAAGFAPPVYTQSAPVCVQPEPVYVPASTLYVIPYPSYYPSATYAYYSSYRPYYGGYCGYSRPYCGAYYGGYGRYPSVGVSVSVGFGGRSHGFRHR